ncbi:DegT/DnrJ/EryC1/StrS family aminotransferase [Pontibacillus marinus]|uniref:Glutamine--scyllo-inositol aminotransferase n=1 Tax=Pontibacillus marinus BH030004 = DSM 16465 TaxID=1385511 RepID=A0A0A5G0I4_9BACI|nr:DegT/DnrJ/EryC1/StrS family aminotransferase [Pontibacillus marinus]KGX84565.1 glutamine--scyllo-inositol aminotransferase [Pontibacillus marinus BH030004 = DSM 16465]
MVKLAIDGGTPVRKAPFPEWPIFGKEEEELIVEVLHSRKWGGSNRNKLPDLEGKFAKMHHSNYAISVVNGTLGITVALQAAGVQPGDEVIMPPYTFIATATAALMFGAIPVFVDVEEESLVIDPNKIEDAITERTKAIIPVHIAGASCNMPEINQIAKKHNLVVIEDAAQAVGTEWENKRVGALGDLGSFSFQSGKNITSGEGGMILTNNQQFAETAWSLSNVGRNKKGAWYQHERIGWNLRMTEFQAAIILGQLTRLEEQFQKRERNAYFLDQLLNDIDGIEPLPRDPRVNRHAYHMYMFRLSNEAVNQVKKNEFIERVNGEGIPVISGYVSLNQNEAVIQETAKWLGEERTYSCPISERASNDQVIWLQQRILLGDEKDMEDIAKAIRKVMSSY